MEQRRQEARQQTSATAALVAATNGAADAVRTEKQVVSDGLDPAQE